MELKNYTKMVKENLATKGFEYGQDDARKIWEVVFDTIGEVLEQGDSVLIPEHGKYEAKERAARKGRNPQTGEELQIKATIAPKFTPNKKLKERVKK